MECGSQRRYMYKHVHVHVPGVLTTQKCRAWTWHKNYLKEKTATSPCTRPPTDDLAMHPATHRRPRHAPGHPQTISPCTWPPTHDLAMHLATHTNTFFKQVLNCLFFTLIGSISFGTSPSGHPHKYTTFKQI